MELALKVESVGTEQELRSLYEWLCLDRRVRRGCSVGLAPSGPPLPGSQGPVMDVVSLVISSGFSAASLAVAIAGWRDTQARRPSVTVERPDGVTVTISGRSAEEAQQLVRQLLAEHDNA